MSRPIPESSPNHPWYRDGLEFECRQCGGCCGGEPGYIWMAEHEIRALAEVRGMHPLDFCRLFVIEYEIGFSLRELPNGDCCMLKDGRCVVYDVRPLQCRTWPWWPGNVSSRRAWLEAARRCPGIGHGRRWTLADIAAQLARMKGHP